MLRCFKYVQCEIKQIHNILKAYLLIFTRGANNSEGA